jgi:hypothetical protein
MSRYAAFISYSHADHAAARWLHRGLEGYRLPKALVGRGTPYGPAPRRLPPVFRDRDELPASADLGENLRAALAESRFQIVLCSPRSARSKWVNEEILAFKRAHGEARTLAVIVDGEPYAGDEHECFPPALRFRLGTDGELSDVPAEPIAADIRSGKDGKRLALLKLIAGITGLPLDALARRDAARRQRRLVAITIASLGIAVVTIGLAIYAESQRRIAVQQRKLADASLDFLVGTFSIANPATENPRTITALTILDRVSKRAGTELAGEPAVSARLLRTTGEIYFNLGLPKESERDLRASLAREPGQSEGRARAYLKLSALAYKRGDAKASGAYIDQAEHGFSQGAAYAPQLNAEVAERRGMVELAAGHHLAAAKQLSEAASLYQALDGDHRDDLGRVWQAQGVALLRAKRTGEATALLQRAVASYLAKHGPRHVLTATARQNLAAAAFEGQQLDFAERQMSQAVAVYNQVLEGDHPTLADAQILLGRIRTARGDAAGALAAIYRARSIYGRLYGADNSSIGDADFYAAEAEARRGDIDAALRLFAQTKAIYDKAYGADDPDQVELLLARSRALTGARRFAEARHDCNAAYALQVKIDSKDAAASTIRADCAKIGT